MIFTDAVSSGKLIKSNRKPEFCIDEFYGIFDI